MHIDGPAFLSKSRINSGAIYRTEPPCGIDVKDDWPTVSNVVLDSPKSHRHASSLSLTRMFAYEQVVPVNSCSYRQKMKSLRMLYLREREVGPLNALGRDEEAFSRGAKEYTVWSGLTITEAIGSSAKLEWGQYALNDGQYY